MKFHLESSVLLNAFAGVLLDNSMAFDSETISYLNRFMNIVYSNEQKKKQKKGTPMIQPVCTKLDQSMHCVITLLKAEMNITLPDCIRQFI